MNVTCPECRSVFRVNPAKVPEAGVRARCSVCGGVITVGRSGTAEAWELAGVGTAATGGALAAWAGGAPARAGGAAAAAAGTVGAPPRTEGSASPTAPRQPTPGAVRAALPTPAAGLGVGRFPGPFASPPRPSVAAPGRPALPPATPPRGSMPIPPRAGTPGVGNRPIGAGLHPRPAARPTPAIGSASVASAALHPAAPPSGPAPTAAREPTAPPKAPAPATAASSSAQREPAPPPSSPPAGASPRARPAVPADRRPINPFLANDPNQKARRLARALVSDMITYQPQKRDEGARNGTIKQLFREEIKKSYEEYVDQVGKELADSTTHFQDALNELLAGGKKIF